MRGKNLSLGELAALGPFGPQLLASGIIRGHLSDKGTFLSDKGTFFVGQGDIQCKPAYGPSRPVGQDINLEMLHKPEGNQYQPT